MIPIRFATVAAVAVVLLLGLMPGIGAASDSGRRVLWSHGVTPEFQAQMIDPVLAPPDSGAFAGRLTRLDKPRYFLRLTQPKYVFEHPSAPVEPKDNSVIGPRDFVFLTLPEAAMGRDLYGIYSDLGYGAEDVLQQKDVNMVAIVFRYGDDVSVDITDGPLYTGPNWEDQVIVPTWDKAMDLFAQLANAGKLSSDLSSRAIDMIGYFSGERRDQIKNLPYAILRSLGGPDWEYRKLMESQLGANSHFRGVGVTMNTLSPADGRKGVQEFLGPNRKIGELPEVAIIDLGRMRFVEVHD